VHIRAGDLAGLLLHYSYLGVEKWGEVVEATNRIEVGEVGRTLFVGFAVVPDPWMWERDVDFDDVADMVMCVVEGGFGMVIDGQILVVGVEVPMSTLIVDIVRGREV
jgi:hypothetical protein